MQRNLLPVSGDNEAALTAALESWGDLKPGAGMELVSRLARERRPATAAAIIALAKARLNDEAFVAEINLSDDIFWLQRAKVQALGENRSQAAVAKLLACSSNAQGQNRLLLPWCLDALVQTERPVPPEAFWRYSSDDDPILRAHAIQALTALARRSPGSVPWAAEAVERVMKSYFAHQSEPVADAKLATADFLAALDAAFAVSRLEAIAADPDRSVRLRSRNLLRNSFGQKVAGTAGLVNTGRNYSFYATAVATSRKYWGARLITDRGTCTLRFLSADAPLTVYNFVTLAQQGFFNNLTFPRVVPDFVIQGGDPRNDTDGGPGYSIRCEINELSFVRGSVGMALAGKDTGGSQYFICHSPQPHLDGGYTLFAQVTDGMAVVDRIQLGDRVQRVELIEQGTADARTDAGEQGDAGAKRSGGP